MPTDMQEALNRITPRFPSVIAGIHVGLFQYSLVPAKSPSAVRPDTLHHVAHKNFPVTKVENHREKEEQKNAASPEKGLQRCFLASQRGFEPPAPRLGVWLTM